MKIKNKGKVHPSPSSSSLPSFSPNIDALSVMKLLPAAILALASVLSLEDREVLAYMMTRSMKTTTNSSSNVQDRKKKCKKPSTASHKPPLFDCDCFDCYTCYWFRWDSSPNRELIHQAIEAFEDHLTHGEQSKRNNVRSKRKEKMSRRVSNISETLAREVKTEIPETSLPEPEDKTSVVLSPKDDVSPMVSSDKPDGVDGINKEEVEGVNGELPETTMAVAARNHKGLARKVLPDVLGLINSRLWSLWSPNV